MKGKICAMIGMIGGFIAAQLGGWDNGLATLLIFMGIDYASGLIVAGVFHQSNKSKNGALESWAGWKGLCKKCMTLLLVLAAYRMDLMIGTTYVRDAVVITFCVNEVLSIIENAGLMGIPMPKALCKAVDVLAEKGKQNEQEAIRISLAGSPGNGSRCDVATGIMQNIGMKYDMMQELPNLQQKGGARP